MTTALLLFILVLFYLAYRYYSGWIERRWGIDPARPTPANILRDNRDYVPAPMPVVFGHHFASIAGAAPIIGPIAASVFGWLPVLVWIVFAGIFIGSVHDFGSLYSSIRHKAKPLSQVIGETIGDSNRHLFAIFVWLTSLLVIAAFTSIVADSFVKMPSAGTASILFIGVALLFGWIRRRTQYSLFWLTCAALILMGLSIYGGIIYPLILSKNVWMIIIIGYITVASITPMDILLQPRDYLNSYLLFALIISAVLGLLYFNPPLQMAPFSGFHVESMSLFPLLFVLVACGAISGYHSMFASATTSKQINSERDIRPVAVGAMLVESLLAVVALIAAASLSPANFKDLYQQGGPIAIFSSGLAAIAVKAGIPAQAGSSFVVLAISSFALTSLDSIARVARSIVQDVAERNGTLQKLKISGLLRSPIGATAITIAIGGAAAFSRWQTIWPIFGCANQLIAALVLITLALWLKKSRRIYSIIILPMIFMYVVTTTGLIQIVQSSIKTGDYLLVLLSLLLLSLAVLFAVNSIRLLLRQGETNMELAQE